MTTTETKPDTRLEWARRTIARYEAGEYVNPATLAMARSFLKGNPG